MILELLVKRSARERTAWGMVAILSVVGLCYVAGIAPALESLDGIRRDVATTQSGLELQQRQLTLLRAETNACNRTLKKLEGIPCPWVAVDQADAILQQWQKDAEGFGLRVRSVIRERQTAMRLKGDAPVSLLVVKLEFHGPYANVMKMLTRLKEGPTAVGLEEIIIKGLDEAPYEVDVELLVRLPVVEGQSHA